jgi:hypothetical protein
MAGQPRAARLRVNPLKAKRTVRKTNGRHPPGNVADPAGIAPDHLSGWIGGPTRWGPFWSPPHDYEAGPDLGVFCRF